MKIDLHCHTKKIKKGDQITRNVLSDIHLLFWRTILFYLEA